MGFNTSTGVYTPYTGAESAAPGQVISSATWNSIFTDLSAALTLLGQQLYGTTSVTASSYTTVSTDAFIQVNYAGAVTINLQASSARAGYPITIKDVGNRAHTNNITITPNGADTIQGLSGIVITTNYGGYTLFPITGGWVTRP